jgi:hypothetical protein
MELEELIEVIIEVDRKYISERGTYYHAEQTAKALMEKSDPVAKLACSDGLEALLPNGERLKELADKFAEDQIKGRKFKDELDGDIEKACRRCELVIAIGWLKEQGY